MTKKITTEEFTIFAENSKIRIASICKQLNNHIITVTNKINNGIDISLHEDFLKTKILTNLLNAEFGLLAYSYSKDVDDVADFSDFDDFGIYLRFVYDRYNFSNENLYLKINCLSYYYSFDLNHEYINKLKESNNNSVYGNEYFRDLININDSINNTNKINP